MTDTPLKSHFELDFKMGRHQVKINGVDIAHMVESVYIAAEPGDFPRIILRLIPKEILVNLPDAENVLRLPEASYGEDPEVDEYQSSFDIDAH